ncbi:protein tyrosine phosphatase [Rhodococcus triatomae]|nr:protein tyrosine phosphatase [Rhodococcus triatomae]QNG20178.1 protein tyrosine phosphatase [Rhodococcus triatomae]QNG23906.1 protein tyrosine phosphatase [Rhodococcus triatomae]
MHVLFVCTGNICRSATAERLAVAYAEELGIDDLTVESAGTHAVAGQEMEPTAAKVLEGLGGDPDGFTARMLTPEIASAADLVLTMSEQHREAVLSVAPSQFPKTFTLKEAVRLTDAVGATTVAQLAEARRDHRNTGDPEDVSDPIGKDEETYLTIGSEIAELLGTLTRAVRG